MDNQIIKTITKLRNLTEIDTQSDWFYFPQDIPQPPLEKDIKNWERATPNEKGNLAGEKGRKVRWFAQKIIIPLTLQGYPLEGLSLRLVLTWWAERAQIFVNGKLVQEGDLFDSSTRLLLTPQATPRQEILVSLRLVSPGHDIGALMQSKCVYEAAIQGKRQNNHLDPGFVADELTVIYNYLANFAPEKLAILAREMKHIDWDKVTDAVRFNQSLATLRNRLQPLSDYLKQRCFYLLGHAHLDMAWLWTQAETYQVAKRTFASVLSLQKEYPQLTFGHTTAALYEWIEKHEPQLFTEIQQAVNLGKWELLGGMWVEPEVNLLGGESLVRQLLYGQKYFQRKFGQINKVAWLPDSFGFPWQLPQILSQAGIEYFVTGKLHWNDTTKFPYGCFWWQSPDGSKILTLMSPPNLTGVMDTNPLTMTNCALDWERQTGLRDIFWLPGVGDHGGGPTRDMLEVARRYSSSPFFPQLKFTTATEYLAKIRTSAAAQFPTWNDELYLEFHRGCYTTHAEQKWFNRYSEGLLYQCELFSTLATLLERNGVRRRPYFPILQKDTLKKDKSQAIRAKNQPKIASIWKQVLFNQFHDILPGSSITEVFAEANQNWQEAIKIGEEILAESLKAIAAYIQLPKPPSPEVKPLIIFNPLNWQRSEIVEVALPPGNWQVYNHQSEEVITQVSADGTLLFIADEIPSIGYKVFWLSPTEGRQKTRGKRQKGNAKTNQIEPDAWILENEYLQVTIDSQTGDISKIWDKVTQKEVLSDLGNQLQLFQDEGQYWDAWNIDPDYQQHPLPSPQLRSIKWLEKGQLRSKIRTIKKFNQSEFIQDYILASNSPLLKIKNTVNWQENHVLLKVAFPLAITSDYVTYEIACGAIQRPTKPQTEAEKAKWEVYGLKWADLSIENYGVSFLNDCKYGYDSSPNQLRLTLLRSSTWPDAKADRGLHHFTYALYPHIGDWKSANTVRKGYELNLPLQGLILEEIKPNYKRILPPVGKLLDLGTPNLILMALKQSEDDLNSFILRCYECQGEQAELCLESDLGLQINEAVNLLENSCNYPRILTNNKTVIKPWKIASFRLMVGGDSILQI
jgi:alpha-mannosidase